MSLRVRICAAGLAAAIAVGGALPAAPQTTTQDQYEDVVARLERARKLIAEAEARERGFQGKIARTAAERRLAEVELEELTALVDDAHGRLGAVEAALTAVQAELDAKTTELRETLNRLQAAHDRFSARVAHAYMDGPVSYLEVLIGASSFRDLVARFQYVLTVSDRDRRHVESVRVLRARVVSERKEVSELRDRASAEVARVKAERDRVAALQRAADARHAELGTMLRAQEAGLADARQDKATYLRQQEELQAESQRIASFLRGRSGGEATVAPGGMAWPVSGPVTSGYGYRTHPIFGTKRFHSGIDIGAASGRAVGASAAGEVIFAGTKGGYGNTVMVDHGGGVVTLYAHLSRISRSVGSTVGTGNTVGAVGCSGYCTGPHLHFEVRVNGEPQNPMRWLR